MTPNYTNQVSELSEETCNLLRDAISTKFSGRLSSSLSPPGVVKVYSRKNCTSAIAHM